MFAVHAPFPDAAEADAEAVHASRDPRCDRFVPAALADGDPRRARRESCDGSPDRLTAVPRIASERARRISRAPAGATGVAG